jgi:hypothetical protein
MKAGRISKQFSRTALDDAQSMISPRLASAAIPADLIHLSSPSAQLVG